ncbi:MAG: chaperone modulator CbpM [Reyranellaceae bacterium]
MTTLDELLRGHARLTTVRIETWVRRGLLRPTGGHDEWQFEAVDVARAELLAELRDVLGFEEDSLETVVDLLDQVHTLRRQLDALGRAIAAQPPSVREQLAAILQSGPRP